MNPGDILIALRADGFDLTADGDRIRIEPGDRLTDEALDLIRTNKPALLELLRPNCERCANLWQTHEYVAGTRRRFWWRCRAGYHPIQREATGPAYRDRCAVRLREVQAVRRCLACGEPVPFDLRDSKLLSLCAELEEDASYIRDATSA